MKKKEKKDGLQYGVVLILKGKYRGMVGIYEDEDDDVSKAVVYLFGCKGYLLLSRNTFRNIDVTEEVEDLIFSKSMGTLLSKPPTAGLAG